MAAGGAEARPVHRPTGDDPHRRKFHYWQQTGSFQYRRSKSEEEIAWCNQEVKEHHQTAAEDRRAGLIAWRQVVDDDLANDRLPPLQEELATFMLKYELDNACQQALEEEAQDNPYPST